MIDRKSFEKRWIESIEGVVDFGGRLVVERTIHAFYLLQKVAKSRLDGKFLFKGGTAVMLLFQKPSRFSVDIDLLVDPSVEEKLPSIVSSFKDEVFVRIEEDIRKPSPIRKRHFKFYYRSCIDATGDDKYVLLDVVFGDSAYRRVEERKIEFPWLLTTEPLKEVPVPSPSDLLGDKLCAFAPHTVGVLFADGKDVETMKQLFDAARLLEHPEIDGAIAFDVYEKLISEQALARGLKLKTEDAMDDALEMCRLIISQGKRSGGAEDYSHLLRGFTSFHSFLPGKYTEIDWLRDAALVYSFLAKRRYVQKTSTPASNNGTFVGRRYRLLRLALKEGISEFMVAVANDPKARQ